MRGSAWHYATRLLAPRSFHSAEGCSGGGQEAGGRSRGQVGISRATRGSVSRPKSDRRHLQPDAPLSAQARRRLSRSPPSLPLPTPSLPSGTGVFLATLCRLSALLILFPYFRP